MRITLILILLLIPAAAGAQSSSAQEIEQVREDARLHLGPFYVTPTIQLKELGVDSNVFNAAGEQVSDFTITIAPTANVWVPVARRALFRATVATDLVWYAKYDTERSVNPQLTGRGEIYLNRITLFAENAYLNTRQRPNFEIDLRSRHLENNLLAGAEVRVTPKFSVEVAGRRFDTEYDADAEFDGTSLQRTLNRKSTGLQSVVRHRLTPLTTLAVRYDNLRDEFEFAPSRDSKSYRVMPGVEFKPRALISGSAYVGYRKFTPAEAAVLPEFSGLVSELGLSYTLLGATTFGVSYRRDLTYSYEETQPFFVDNSVGASVRRALGRRFDVLLSADRHSYAYRDLLIALPVTGARPAPERVDITWNYAGSLGYRIGREGRIGFGVSYWQRESTTKRFRDYDNLRIGTTATYGF
jgi:Putative beta-barrel porin 2